MLPGNVIRDALKSKDVRVNGVKSSADVEVSGGDELKLYIDSKFFEMPLDVLYEDAHILCLDKPAGLPVDVDSDGIGADTVLARAKARYPSARLCHRLDEGTGGCLLLALTDEAERALLSAFREHRMKKLYQAVVLSCPEKQEAVLKGFLSKDAGFSRVRVARGPEKGAVPIETHYKVLKERLLVSDALCLIEVRLLTGRTHQIRAHMASIGHPILGDDKYGERDMNKQFRVKMPMLWCVKLAYDGLIFTSKPNFPLE